MPQPILTALLQGHYTLNKEFSTVYSETNMIHAFKWDKRMYSIIMSDTVGRWGSLCQYREVWGSKAIQPSSK